MKQVFTVEWEFTETKYGVRPMWIKFFNTREEAVKFATEDMKLNHFKIDGSEYFRIEEYSAVQ